MMTASVVELAARCVVAVYGGAHFLGSGFMIAPGRVLTCAHVAAEAAPGPLTIRLAGGELTASQVQLIPAEAEPGRRTYGPPDLALITIDEQPDQSPVWIAERGPDAGSDVLCLGFSEATTEARVAADSVILRVAAASGGGFVRVQQGEIPRGMSGGLVLDLDTNRVCGVVKASRDPDAPRGGWVIPGSLIAAHLGAVVEQNMACHDATSPWRQVATRHAEFARRLFGSRSPLHVADAPGNAPPSWWLDPRHRVTRFQERPELESLLAWASDQAPQTPVVRLVVGEGGSGKTRLAVELATRLAARGWIAGIVTADDLARLPLIAQALDEILAFGHRVFIAIDYPEGMGDELTRFLAQLPLSDGGLLRVLLLARFGGDWWDSLHPAGGIKYLIDGEPVHLTPLGRDPHTTAAWFGEVLGDYRLRISRADAAEARIPPCISNAVPPALIEAAGRHASAIKVHALALVSALYERDRGTLPDGEVAFADPLDSLVNHERRHWAEAARGRALSSGRDLGWARRILLVPTLLAVYRREAAITAMSRIPGFAERFPGEAPVAATLLRDLYPPDESVSLRWWSPLPLDRLGETLLADVFKTFTEDEAFKYVTELFRVASAAEAVQGLTVMTRLSSDKEMPTATLARLSRCLEALATVDDGRLLPALLIADRQVPPGVQRPGECSLARLDPAGALVQVQQLNQNSVPRPIQGAALVLLDHVDRVLATEETQFSGVPRPAQEMATRKRDSGIDVPVYGLIHILAMALRAEALMRLGRVGEAIGPAETAAREVRVVHRASNQRGVLFDGNLLVVNWDESDSSTLALKILDIYAEALHTLGRLAEAAEVGRERVAIAQLAATDGDPDCQRVLVNSLCDLTEALLELGQAEQAEPWARDAVERARSLPGMAPKAATLALWAKTLNRTGRTNDAQVVAGDTARLLDQDAGRTIDRVRAAQIRQSLGDLAPPGAMPELLTELRRAASLNPVMALPALISAALQRAEQSVGEGDLADASSHMREALISARRLAADDPETNMRFLAFVLQSSSRLRCGTNPEAEMAEAVRIYRRMTGEQGRDDLRPDLALALMDHAVLLRDAGQDADSLPGFAEAVELLRPLLAHDRWRNTPYLCTALALFAETAAKHGDREQAVAAAREAIDLELTRTDDVPPYPAEHLPELRHTLFIALAMVLGTRASQGADPAVIAATVAEIRQIARSLPVQRLTDSDRRILAGALGILGIAHADSGDPENALPSLAEALGILRGIADPHLIADRHPEEAVPELLFQIGHRLLLAYKGLGRHPEAARVAAEILADCRSAQPLWEQRRYDCVRIAADVVGELPRPAYTAQALRFAIALARTCREWLPRGDLGQVLLSAAVIQLSRDLADATRDGVAPDDCLAAAKEISASAALLSEQAYLVRAGHAQAVAQAASLLADNGQLEEALDLNTRALHLYQFLAARHNDLDPLPGIASLVQQGVLLAGQGRLAESTGPLEQALPVLLAAGSDISTVQAGLLSTAIDILRQAYQALGWDDAGQALIDAFNASGVPSAVPSDKPAPKEDSDLYATLQTAKDEATSDPERSVAVFRELLLNPKGTRDYLIAWATCGEVVTALSRAGRFRDALHLCDLLIASGSTVGIKDWTRIEGGSRRLDVQLSAGLDPRAILAEAVELIAKVDEIQAESDARNGLDLSWARETLLHVSARAALALVQWPEELRFANEEAASLREHDASLPEVAFAEFSSYSALVAMGRVAEAEDLLDRCEAAFRQDHHGRDLRLGLLAGARADLAANTGDPVRAVRLQSKALAILYQSRNVMQIQRGHAALGRWHAQADQHAPAALAHALAAAMLAELTGHSPDIESVMRSIYFRAGECSATLAAICAVMDDALGPKFTEILESLCQSSAVPVIDEMLARLVEQARDSQRYLFEKMAEHTMRWDPVFAGMARARRGELAAATAVKYALRGYAEDADWSQLCLALGHVFYQRPEPAAAVPLDIIDAIMLRRCADALDDLVRIPPELAYAMTFSNVLAEVLFAAQNGRTSPALARAVERLAGNGRPYQRLAAAIQKILAGERRPQIASGLDDASAVIIATLLGHLSAP